MDDADLPKLVGQAVSWRDADPDPRTRRELDGLIERVSGGDRPARAAARRELVDRFAGSLQFGTAGLRGALGAGPNRMNRAVVIRAARGLADHLLAVIGTAPAPLVVVGFDARHDSDVFARDTCAVATAAGCRALLLPGPLPTPVLAFAVRELGADAGVMVTASHNPPQDNGYKVYLGGRATEADGRGAQIVPPDDERIAARIAAAPRAIEVPLSRNGWQQVDPAIVEQYVQAVTAVVAPAAAKALDVVVTPLHGVGGEVVVHAFHVAGFAVPHLVPEQALPDPDFPTVSFPNPEEPGAMDLALAAARSRAADLVIANDPDADRCAVAVPDPNADHGRWRVLRGDEIGVLLGDHVLGAVAGTGRDRRPVVASTIVSSQLLARVAAAHGAEHVETLTGFKWLSRVPGLVYAYEEALGYCVAPHLVRDKDGISAALLVADLAARLRAEGRTLLDALDDLARTHGVHLTDQYSLRLPHLERVPALLEELRGVPPEALGGDPVVSVDDLGAGVDGLPPTPGIRFRTAGGARVVVRPSGTEPKLKCYLEVVVPVGPGDAATTDPLPAARAVAGTRLTAVRRDMEHLLTV